jgi:transcriptional regulator with XRE-family HTH domain
MLMILRLQAGWSVAKVAQALGVTPKTVRKWRGSRPHRSPNRLDQVAEAEIETCRRPLCPVRSPVRSSDI